MAPFCSLHWALVPQGLGSQGRGGSSLLGLTDEQVNNDIRLHLNLESEFSFSKRISSLFQDGIDHNKD